MKLICDTNIILDVVLKRDPFYTSSVGVLHMCEAGDIEGIIPASSMTNLFYKVRRLSHSSDTAYKALDLTRQILSICSVTAEDERLAFDRRHHDYEDCLLAMTAASNGCDFILTRNKADFSGFSVPAISPDELLDMFMR